MPSVAGWLAQLPPRARAVRGGLHPLSAVKIAAGRHGDVRLRGVRVSGPDPRAVANTAVEVAAGEYAAPGFEIAAGERVVDGGANVGAFAILAARAGAEVVAYEPHPPTFDALERNTGRAGGPLRARRPRRRRAQLTGTVAFAAGASADTQGRVGGAGATPGGARGLARRTRSATAATCSSSIARAPSSSSSRPHPPRSCAGRGGSPARSTAGPAPRSCSRSGCARPASPWRASTRVDGLALLFALRP